MTRTRSDHGRSLFGFIDQRLPNCRSASNAIELLRSPVHAHQRTFKCAPVRRAAQELESCSGIWGAGISSAPASPPATAPATAACPSPTTAHYPTTVGTAGIPRPRICDSANVFITYFPLIRSHHDVRNKQAERNLMLNLWKVTVSNREAQEAETKRRQDWERQIEEKQADTDQKIEQHIGSVNEQLSAIRSLLAGLQAAPTPTTRSPAVALASPVSPAAQPQAFLRPAFLQGSSTNPFPTLPNFPSFYHTSPSTSTTVEPHSAVQYQNVGEAPPSAQTYTPDPSPQLTSVEGAKATNKPPPSASQPAKKKRRRKTDTSDAEASSDSESEVAVYPRKRKNHHDTECYTLHVRDP